MDGPLFLQTISACPQRWPSLQAAPELVTESVPSLASFAWDDPMHILWPCGSITRRLPFLPFAPKQKHSRIVRLE